MRDYRKSLALIVPGFLTDEAEVWMSETAFERLRAALEKVMSLGVEFELLRAVETPTGLDLQYRAYGTGPAKMQADRLMLALCKD